jgi:hypothetical protein
VSKTITTFLILSIALISLTTIASALSDIAYIIKNEQDENPFLLNEIQNLGFSIQTIYDDEIPNTDFSEFKLIILGGSKVMSNLEILPVHLQSSLIINSNGQNIIELGWSSGKGSTTNPSLKKINFEHPIGESIPQSFNAYINSQSTPKIHYLTGQKPVGINFIFSRPASASDAVVTTVSPGTFYLNGNEAQGHSAFFGATEVEFWKPETHQLFSNTIQWLLDNTIDPNDGKPVFDEILCEQVINEDIEYNCQLSASNHENDPMIFSTGTEENLECTIKNNNELHYKSSPDYNGLASCELIVTDVDGSTSLIFDTNILPINDAPRILSKNPEEIVIKIPFGFAQDFQINAIDVDSQFSISWLLNNQEVSTTESYFFDQPKGTYILQVLLSDSEFQTSNIWSIIVGDSSQFTCNEVSGEICSTEEVCSSDFIDVKDTNLCCTITCEPKPPEFKDADTCNAIDSRFDLKITNVESDLELGKKAEVEIEIINNFDKDQNIEVEVFLYDLTEDKVISEAKEEFELGKGRRRQTSIDILIPENPDDIDLDNDFAIFVKAEDKICNQDFKDITINRPEKKIFIKEINFPEKAFCGERIKAKIELENIGKNDQDISIEVESNSLDISEESNIFEIRSRDEESEDFTFDIPTEINSGIYEIQFKILANKALSETREINIQCQTPKQQITQLVEPPEPIQLSSSSKQESLQEPTQSPIALSLLMTMSTLLLSGLLLSYIYLNKKKL